MSIFLIGLIFCIGFFVESIIGFGGTLVAFAILGFFIDIKQLILMAIFIATSASILVVASDYKSFVKEIFFKSFPFCLIGTIVGSAFFIHQTSQMILICFGAFLLILSAKVMFFDDLKLPKHLSNFILFIGGISQGIFGIGGPFFAIALKDHFQNKSKMRATLATFFISFNIIRVCQFSFSQTLNLDLFLTFWWIPAPLAVAIHLGHVVHKKLSESKFKKIVALLSAISGFEFLFKK